MPARRCPPTKAPAAASSRLPAVDGLRGLLAVSVLAWHGVEPLGLNGFGSLADIAVDSFFVLSGYVLTRSWGAPYPQFLLRRFVRLWPTYAVCLSGAYAVAGLWPTWSLYLWWPIVSPEVDPPIWSLCVEAWAMPFMPMFVALALGPQLIFLGALALASLAFAFHWKLGLGVFFLIGAYFSRWELRNGWLESAAPQTLGRISYSLYLSHWILMAAAKSAFGPWGPLLSAPLAFPFAWIVWRFVEAPSIRLSRRVGSRSAERSANSMDLGRPPPIRAPA